EAGTGYFRKSWDFEELPANANLITVDNPNENIAWGAAYLQYYEDMDKVTSFKETPVKMDRTVYKEVLTSSGPELRQISEMDKVSPGDRLKVRLEIVVDRDLEFVHLKDGRGAGFEPENVFSGYRWQGRLGYYESTRDASSNFFVDYLPKGTHVFEYPLRAVHKGDYSAGLTSLQCMYAPAYTSHSEGIRLQIE
ncbi:MAG: hypothetical protein HKN16_02755, partial [Saprospiraceae bacterium]|nr:hypothetical protein [Saprospiraceae bacterium]